MNRVFEAYDKSAKLTRATIEAKDKAKATDILRRHGMHVIQSRSKGNTSSISAQINIRPRSRGKRMKILADFTRQFHVLNTSGTPIVNALAALERQTNDNTWRQVIHAMRSRVEEGTPLSEAMHQFPTYFDPIYTSLIAAGESTGKLTEIFKQLASVTRKQVNLRNNIVGALLYPTFLSLIAVIVFVLMLTVVVPNFIDMFKILDAPLPASTQIIIKMSTIIKANWLSLLIVLASIVAGMTYWMNTNSGKYVRDSAMLRFPLIGQISRSLATARLARFLGILLDSHMPLIDTLDLLRRAMSNIHYVELITKAEKAVTRGEPISAGFANSPLINPSVYEAIRSGEQSGQIAPSLIQIADFMDEDNEVTVRSLGSLIEPLILVILGLVVGAVALSMFIPLFDLTSIAGG